MNLRLLWEDLEEKIKAIWNEYGSGSIHSTFHFRETDSLRKYLYLEMGNRTIEYLLYLPEQVTNYTELLNHLMQQLKRHITTGHIGIPEDMREQIIKTPLPHDGEVLILQNESWVEVSVDTYSQVIKIPNGMNRSNVIATYRIYNDEDYYYIDRHSVGLTKPKGEVDAKDPRVMEVQKKSARYTIDRLTLQKGEMVITEPNWLRAINHYTDFYVNPNNLPFHKYLYESEHAYKGENIYIFSPRERDFFVLVGEHWLLFDVEWFGLNGYKFHEKAHQELLLYKNMRILQV